MPLPPLVPPGVLPALGHDATADEVEAVFVSQAPSHREQRRLVWLAFDVWRSRARHYFGPGAAWLAGSFVTHMIREPELRVVFFPTTPSMSALAKAKGDTGLGLLTLEDVFFMTPAPGGSVQAMRPVGGLLDAWVGSAAHDKAWEAMWSVTSDPRSRTLNDAGYVRLRM